LVLALEVSLRLRAYKVNPGIGTEKSLPNSDQIESRSIDYAGIQPGHSRRNVASPKTKTAELDSETAGQTQLSHRCLADILRVA
jgi:hypothetical protein